MHDRKNVLARDAKSHNRHSQDYLNKVDLRDSGESRREHSPPSSETFGCEIFERLHRNEGIVQQGLRDRLGETGVDGWEFKYCQRAQQGRERRD